MAFFSGSENKPLIAAGLDIQTSTNVLSIAIGWGINVLSGNLTWADKFQYHNTSGGKGGPKGDPNYYSAWVMIALMRGVTSAMPRIFEGNQLHSGPTSTYAGWLAGLGGTMLEGSSPFQTPWSGWGGDLAYASLNYPSISYLGIPGLNLGGSPTPPNYNFVIACDPAMFAPYSSVFAYVDNGYIYKPWGADPGLVFQDLIAGDITMGRGFPGLGLDVTTLLTANAPNPSADSTLQTWCYANGVHFSPFLRQAEKGTDIVDRWCQILNAEVGYWDQQLKIIPRGDTAQTGNGLTFTPVTTAVLALTSDDFITQDEEEPIQIARKPPEECFNVVRVEVMDPNNEWSPVPIEVRNEVDFLTAGNVLRIMPTVQAHEVNDPINVAPLLAQLALQKQQSIRNTYTFKVAPTLGALLTPMDIVTLTDAQTNLSAYPVRIRTIASDSKDLVTITAEDYLQGVSTAPLYATQPGLGVTIDTNADPGPVNPPIIYEPPSTLYSPAQLLFVLSGGFGNEQNAFWGGCRIYAQLGTSGYTQIGETTRGPADQGLLTATLPAYSGANPDNTNTLNVDLNESGGTLTTFPSSAAALGASLCYVDGELIAYMTATLTSITINVSELWFVPASPGPYTVTVHFAADFVSDRGVVYTSSGTPLTHVMGTPAAGQYAVNTGTGVYTFAAADTGLGVTPSYSRTASGYALTGLYRGLYGTTPGAHASGAKFGFIDNSAAIVKLALPPQYIGQTIDFKFPSLNTWGNGLQDLSVCTVYPYTVLGTGYGGGLGGVPTTPTGLTGINFNGGTQTATITASETLAADALVDIWDNGGTANVRNANATDNTKPADGFVLAAVSSGNPAVVSFTGSQITGLAGIVRGQPYFLSTTGGALTATPPSTGGNLVQQVGVGSDPATLNFVPQAGVTL